MRRSLLTPEGRSTSPPEGRSTHGTDSAASGSPSGPSSRLGSPLGSLGQPRAAWDPFSPSRPFSPVPGVVSPDRAGTGEAGEAGEAWGGGGSGLRARVKVAKDLAEAAETDLRAKELAEAAAGEGLRALSLARQRVGESPSGHVSGYVSPLASESPESPRAGKGGGTSSPRPWKLRIGPPLPVVPLATLTADEEVVEVGDAGDASDGGGMGAAAAEGGTCSAPCSVRPCSVASTRHGQTWPEACLSLGYTYHGYTHYYRYQRASRGGRRPGRCACVLLQPARGLDGLA